MSPNSQKLSHPLASLFVSACSFILWLLVGELRWEYRRWHLTMTLAGNKQVFGTMWWLDCSSKVLGLGGIVWTAIACRKTPSWFAKLTSVIGIMVFLISFVP